MRKGARWALRRSAGSERGLAIWAKRAPNRGHRDDVELFGPKRVLEVLR